MLILTRKVNEEVVIDKDIILRETDVYADEIKLEISRRRNDEIIVDGDIVIKVIDVMGDKAKLGFLAPKEVDINRAEIEYAKRNHPRH